MTTYATDADHNAALRQMVGLSFREIETLQTIADGKTVAEAAEAMFVSIATVRSHLKSCYGKLEVSTLVHAVVRASRLGYITL